MREQILQALQANPEQGYNKSEFARLLSVEPSQRSAMRRTSG